MSEARERLTAAQDGRRQRGLHPKGTDQTYEEQTRVLMTWTKAELVRSLIREESDKLKAIDELIDARAAQAVSLPDRETLKAVITATIDGRDKGRALPNDEFDGRIADAVLAALSTQPAAGEVESKTSWDVRDAEPEGVNGVIDYTGDDEDGDSARWSRTTDGEWKGYKNGGKVYLSWDELMRRWGPVTSPAPELFPGTLAALDHLSIRPEEQS